MGLEHGIRCLKPCLSSCLRDEFSWRGDQVALGERHLPGVAELCLCHEGSPRCVWTWEPGCALLCAGPGFESHVVFAAFKSTEPSLAFRLSRNRWCAGGLPASDGAPLLLGALSFVTTLTLCFDYWFLYASFLYHCFSDGAVNFFESGSLGFLGFPIP